MGWVGSNAGRARVSEFLSAFFITLPFGKFFFSWQAFFSFPAVMMTTRETYTKPTYAFSARNFCNPSTMLFEPTNIGDLWWMFSGTTSTTRSFAFGPRVAAPPACSAI